MSSYFQIHMKYSHTFSIRFEIRANIYGENGTALYCLKHRFRDNSSKNKMV